MHIACIALIPDAYISFFLNSIFLQFYLEGHESIDDQIEFRIIDESRPTIFLIFFKFDSFVFFVIFIQNHKSDDEVVVICHDVVFEPDVDCHTFVLVKSQLDLACQFIEMIFIAICCSHQHIEGLLENWFAGLFWQSSLLVF